MGVGAKASTPINLNDNRNTQKQQRQTNNEQIDETNISSQGRDSTKTWYLNSPYDHNQDYEPGELIEQYLQENYTLWNQNINAEFKRYGRYDFIEPWDPDTGQALYPGNVYGLQPEYITGATGYTTPQEVYIYRINGNTKGFKNVNFYFNANPNNPQFTVVDPGSGQSVEDQYGIEWQKTGYLYQTTENIDNFFYEENVNNLDLHDPRTLYNRFTTGNLKATRIQYNTSGNLLYNNNVTLIANKVNYLCFFAYTKMNATINPAEFKTELEEYRVLVRGNNDIQHNRMQSILTQIHSTRSQDDPAYHYELLITGQSVELANIYQEVIDIPGLIWEILSMPFAFISTAFNLTLFPGTQYSINIANLVLTIFGVLVFVFILKLLIKK